MTAPVGVLASRVRFEEKQIFAALDRRGVPYVHLDTRRISAPVSDAREASARTPTSENPSRGRRSEQSDTVSDAPEAYAAVLNREISQSRGYYASLLFESWGVPTVNRAAVIELCGDKLRTSLELRRSGLPTPRTALALTPEAALDAAELLGYPIVIKPLTGSWGRLAALLRDRAEAETVLEHRAALPSPQQHIIYLQELVEAPGRDIRVLVVGERLVAASYRYAEGWRTNVRRGGRSEPCPPTPELTGLALAAAKAVGGGVLGVDLIEGPDGLQVLEVNHTVEFQGLQGAHRDVDVAEAIVAHVLDAA